MEMAQRLKEARRRFARSLVGRWSTCQGTFDHLMGQHWEFRPDGTGTFTDTGRSFHPEAKTRFEWRQAGDFLIELRLTAYTEFGPDKEPELLDEEWQAIQYDFVPVKTDPGGVEIGLIDVAQAAAEMSGFLNSLAPLAYEGPVGEGGGAPNKAL